MVTTFGPGALVDLVDHAVIVGGLDFWHYGNASGGRAIDEPRLRDRLVEHMGLDLDAARPFRAPPVGIDNEANPQVGAEVLEFPQWFVCQHRDCRRLVARRDLDERRNRYVHQCNDKTASEAVPVRFVAVCPAGHIDDVHWIYFAHRGQSCTSVPRLALHEGPTGDFSDISVKCIACKAERPLRDLKVPALRQHCSGKRPWLGELGTEKCSEQAHLLTRTATNTYFTQQVSSLSIPDGAEELRNAVDREWATLQVATAATLPVFRQIPSVKAALGDLKDEEILAAIEARKNHKQPPRGELRTEEYRVFLAQPAESPGEMPGKKDKDFFARRLVSKPPPDIERVVVAHLLREVRAQVGFTRLESLSANLQGEYDQGELKIQAARLGLTSKWLPACEIRGEGVFFTLDEVRLVAWEKEEPVKKRALELRAGFETWARSVGSPMEFPGIRFYLLHSLAHLLVSAISLECGYSASAIRERIYCERPGTDKLPMAGILLHTGTSGSEGTLGGLVDQGRRLGAHLTRALRLGHLCSNDPVCASHSPRNDLADRPLEGAACHGCLFLAECSCERNNRYLDRALVVPTIGHEDLAFFPEPG